MKYTNLGSTGLKVSRICLGTMTYGSRKWRDWVLEEDEARPFYRRAIEAGINFFDTADVYSLGVSEEITGRALKDFAASRQEVVIATKVFNAMGEGPNSRGLSRKHIQHAAEQSLKRLGTDYIDLYQIHRYDRETPIEETLEALDALVRAGKVLHIGASSMFAWEFARMLAVSERRGLARFATMQNHYNLIYREEEREMNPLCLAEGIGIIPWSPLARGLLLGNRKEGTVRARTDDFSRQLYGKEIAEADEKVIAQVQTLAEKKGVPPARIAIAWHLHKPGIVAPIIGASKLGHLEDAIAALAVSLSPEEMALLEEPYMPHPIAGHS